MEIELDKAVNRHKSIQFKQAYKQAYILFRDKYQGKELREESFAMASMYEGIYYTNLNWSGNPIMAADLAQELFRAEG